VHRLNNLKPLKVVKAFERYGWINRGQQGKHIKLTKPGNPNILSIPNHKGKDIKQGTMKQLISKAGLTTDEFLKLYKS